MRKVSELLKHLDCKPYRYTKNGKVILVDTDRGSYVIKDKKKDNSQIFAYLKSRNFDYYPKVLYEEDDYQILQYIDDINSPLEQKIADMIDLVSLLHSKTTYFKEIEDADYQQIYEDISNNILYLRSYYQDLITIIETKVYMSPSHYLLARNIEVIINALDFSENELEKWYKIVGEKRKKRVVVVHNNLDLSHFIKDNNPYLISWDKARIDTPVFDLYKLYKKHAIEIDFFDILKRYEHNYPLLEEERMLFFILIALPSKIEFDDSIYNMCIKIGREIDRIYKTESLISPYYPKDTIKDD